MYLQTVTVIEKKRVRVTQFITGMFSHGADGATVVRSADSTRLL